MSRCKLGVLLDAARINSKDGEWSSLTRALLDSSWSAKAISTAIKSADEGVAAEISIGATTIKDHRNMVCACYD